MLGLFCLIGGPESTEPSQGAYVVAPAKKEMTTEERVREYYKDTPILSEIAWCESQFRQYDKNGNVLQGRVDPDDTGVMQINKRYHLDSATKMGLNIEQLNDNLKYAKILYESQGTKPWNASKPCWG